MADDRRGDLGGQALDGVAIVGMAGRFPGARDLERFWDNLRQGVESISSFSDEELAAAGVPATWSSRPDAVRAASVLDGAELFDARFFGLSPREAELTDPQHRLLLECAWEALESAGCDPERYPGRIGVFAGCALNTYLLANVYPNAALVQAIDPVALQIAADKDYLAHLISYQLNLRGPSVTVQTACSTALVAVHLGCQSLTSYQCDAVLAGAVTVKVPQKTAYLYSEGGVQSPDGRCRPFDAAAAGTGFGSGLGLVVLKRLEDALADGDPIRAVIRGSAINNDGRQKVGYTAPSLAGQTEVIALAQAVAEVEPESIGFVEAHGTGTPLGDSIELDALREVFATERRGFCALGSVKGNFGHLEVASGIAGLMKAVLAIEHGEIPPTVNFERPNPRLDLERSPFYVNAELRPWPRDGGPRRAAVHSYAIGGTNAHLVLEEAPAAVSSGPSRQRQLLLLSARTAAALTAAAGNLARHLEARPELPLADVAYTLQVGRSQLEHRLFTVCGGRSEALGRLAAPSPPAVTTAVCEAGHRPVAFLLPSDDGGRSRRWSELYAAEAAFRQEVDGTLDLLAPGIGRAARELFEGGFESGSPAAVALAARVAAQIALARLFLGWGIRPQAVLGCGVGEYAAAVLAEVLPAPSALALAVRDGLRLDAECGTATPGIAEPAPEVSPKTPTLAFLSARDGGWVPPAAAASAARWRSPAGSPDRLESALGALLEEPRRVLLEIGPGTALTGAAAPLARAVPAAVAVAPLGGEAEAQEALLEALGRLWTAGLEIDWRQFYGSEERRRVELPSYPFERRRYWIDPPAVRRRKELESRQEALPAAHPRPEIGIPYSAPRNELERPIAEIWRQAFGFDRVGVDDDFFALGGHSVLALGVGARIREMLGVELPLTVLAGARTVAAQAVAVARQAVAGIGPERLRRAMAEAGSALEELPPERFRSLLRRLREDGEEAPAELVPAPAERHRPFPLTDVQHAYWIGRSGLVELGGVSSYSYAEYLVQDLDHERLEGAVRRLIDRHEMLRAVILTDGRQRVLPEVPPYRIAVLDLGGLTNGEAAAKLAAVRAEMSHQVLPADRWPLFDLRISRLGGHRSLIHLGFDILIGDLWSLRILGSELRRLYADPGLELTPLELSFRDYVLFQKAAEESAEHRRAEVYWEHQLAELPPAPDLPMTRLETVGAPHFRRRSAELDPELWRRLREGAAGRGVTPSCLLMTAYALVLATWSKHRRLTLNVTTFNRLPVHPEVDRVVGDFTSLTLLAVDFTRPASFAERAAEVQQTMWRNLEHSQVSGVRLMRRIAQARGGGPGPVLPVVFTGHLIDDGEGPGSGGAAPGPEPATGGETLTAGSGGEDEAAFGELYSISQTPQVWLDHQASQDRGRLVFNWDAVEELFPPGLLDDMFAAYCALLESLAEEAGWQRRDPIRLGPEHLAARTAANDTAAPVPAGLLHQPFAARAAEAPARPAVIAPDRTLTYGELDRRSDALGAELVALGAAPGRLVAVVLEKGWRQAVAVLAVLKAGAAYLPVDPALPAARREQFLRRGAVTVAVTRSELAAELEWPSGIERVAVPEEEPPPSPPLAARQQPGDLAYVIFTSGSTGEPKGVMIDHRGALNTVADVNRRFAIGPEDRIFGISSLSFDLSVYDLFGTLAAGAALVLPPAEARRDPSVWLALLAAERVTVWNSVPALMRMLVEHAGQQVSPPAPLRLALLSGDWIPVRLPERVRALFPGIEVISLGGATEASIWSILYPIGEVDPEWESIPYGRPMVNQSFQVLDPLLEPRPTWVPGELYIGGIGVALGYWKDEERTRASFVEHPATGERLYRTGDLGRYLPDGTLQFLGREDSQVKIQGHRIELGEIEAVLEQHPAVRTAVVVAAGADRDARSLAAYLVPAALPTALEAGAAGHAETGSAAEAPWVAAARERQQARELAPGTVPARALGRLLGALTGIRLERWPLVKHRYPSAGHLYPVQSYLHLRSGRVPGIAGGLYYHHPHDHRLVPLATGEAADRRLAAATGAPEEAAAVLFLVARLRAIAPTYGELAADFCLLEAGYMTQLLTLEAAGHRLAIRPLSAPGFAEVAELFELEEGQPLLQVLAVGPAGAAAESGVHTMGGTGPGAWRRMREMVSAAAASAAAGGGAGDAIAGLELKLSSPGVRRDLGGSAVSLEWPDESELAGPFEQRRTDRELRRPVPGGAFRELLGDLARLLPELRPPGPGGAGEPPFDLLIQIEPEGVEGWAPGVYGFDPGAGELTRRSREPAVPVAAHHGVNRPVAEAAGFSILVTAPAAGDPDRALLTAGAWGQVLMTVAPARAIGFCPVGSMDAKRLASEPPWGAGRRLIHTFLGGGIAESRIPALGAPFAAGERGTAALPDLSAELRAHLAARLPEHMVPVVFVTLEALPLTARGKVDRGALARREVTASAADGAEQRWVAPRTPLEERMAELWSRILGLERVGIHHRFFALGGDSVQAVQFLAQARERGIGIEVREFFELQTIAELARVAREVPATEPAEAAPAPEPAAEGGKEGYRLADFPDAELTEDELAELVAEFDFADDGDG